MKIALLSGDVPFDTGSTSLGRDARVKGIIFNLAEEVVVAEHGEDAWDAVLDGAGLAGSYTSLGSYPDADLTAIVDEAARQLGTDSGSVLRHVAQGAIPRLAARRFGCDQAQGYLFGRPSTAAELGRRLRAVADRSA